MAWNAYPWKNGELLDCPINMHSGSYGHCLAEMTGLSVRVQPDDIKKEPSWDADVVKSIYDLAKDEDFSSYRNAGTPIEQATFEQVKNFLKWCVDNECGIWFSF